MQVIRNVCGKVVHCIESCFKSEQQEYEEKMIELEQRIKLTNN